MSDAPNSAMPVIFFGHGNPMNAIETNDYTRGWSDIGRGLGRPKGVLAISAHWYIPRTAVTVNSDPPTIHDFGGFPRALFDVEYPAPGDPKLAERVRELLAPVEVMPDDTWGLDHGTWSVLCHVFPGADVPIVQLSINAHQPPEWHYEMAGRLAPLRDDGVLVMGTGNAVHNLRHFTWGREPEPYPWAERFDALLRALIDEGEDSQVVDYPSLGQDARLAVPTPEHFLPLLYVLALRRPGDEPSYPVTGIDGGSVSMLSVRLDASDGSGLL